MIELRAVSKSYGRTEVLAPLDLDVEAGEAIALAGTAGAGRSTLLDILATLRRPTSGSVEIGGVDASRHPVEARGRIAYAPQAPEFVDDLTAGEYLGFIAAARLPDESERQAAVATALETAGLSAELSTRTLSCGHKRLLAVAAALLPDAPLLLLDEPLAGLGPLARAEIGNRLEQRRRSGATIVMADNRPGDAVVSFDKVLLLHGGRVVGESNGNAGVAAALARLVRTDA